MGLTHIRLHGCGTYCQKGWRGGKRLGDKAENRSSYEKDRHNCASMWRMSLGRQRIRSESVGTVIKQAR